MQDHKTGVTGPRPGCDVYPSGDPCRQTPRWLPAIHVSGSCQGIVSKRGWGAPPAAPTPRSLWSLLRSCSSVDQSHQGTLWVEPQTRTRPPKTLLAATVCTLSCTCSAWGPAGSPANRSPLRCPRRPSSTAGPVNGCSPPMRFCQSHALVPTGPLVSNSIPALLWRSQSPQKQTWSAHSPWLPSSETRCACSRRAPAHVCPGLCSSPPASRSRRCCSPGQPQCCSQREPTCGHHHPGPLVLALETWGFPSVDQGSAPHTLPLSKLNTPDLMRDPHHPS